MKCLKFLILFTFFFPSLVNGLEFAEGFYTKNLKECSYSKTFSNHNLGSEYKVKTLKKFIGIDWNLIHEKESTSEVVRHDSISKPTKIFAIGVHNALTSQENIDVAVNLLLEIVEAETLLDTMTFQEVKTKPRCYANGPDSPCYYHRPQNASIALTTIAIIAFQLKKYMNEDQKTKVDEYLDIAYRKFFKPKSEEKVDRGFYQQANGGLSILAYAAWKNDVSLAEKEIKNRLRQIDELFYDDGYIKDNSFRGDKGLWYHSLGLNSALGYVYLLQEWGVEIPKDIFDKLKKSSEVMNNAIINYDDFKSRKYNEKITNMPIIPYKHVHQDALGINVLIKLLFGIEMNKDRTWKYIKDELIQFDDIIGFNPNCLI